MVVGSKWKDYDNLYNWGVQVCTSSTRPTAYDGRPIYETDTNKYLIYNGASWEEVGGGAGAGDFMADGSVAMTGNIQMGSNKITGLAAATANGDALRYEQLVGAYLLLSGGTMTGNLTIFKANPYLYLKPTDASSPAVLLKDSADNIKGRMYTTGDDMVVRPDDGHLYLSTTVSTGGNVILETKGVARLTIADTGLTATKPLAMGNDKITGLAAATSNGDALRYEQLVGAYLPLVGGTLTGNLGFNKSWASIQFATGDVINFDDTNNSMRMMIGGVVIGSFNSNDLAMTTGKKVSFNGIGGATHIKDVSGNMELHVATGKSVKIVVG